jgi:Trk-type K+ transport system membrane component
MRRGKAGLGAAWPGAAWRGEAGQGEEMIFDDIPEAMVISLIVIMLIGGMTLVAFVLAMTR